MLNTFSPTISTLFTPAWANKLLQHHPARFAISTERVIDTDRLSDSELQARVLHAYNIILNHVSARKHYPVRFWNNVPSITSAASEERNRYMIFNAGRYEALTAFYGNSSQFDASMPAATAVDAGGNDIEIVCLSADAPALSLNNPRQVAPYHYSRRFGPLPPCFARAVRLAFPENALIAGGTAAIRGEDSVYREDLSRQIHESLANLSALIGAAKNQHFATDKTPLIHLDAYRELRVYFPNAEHETIIRQAIQNAFPTLRSLELIVANLCRPELLIEIEGIAELAP